MLAICFWKMDNILIAIIGALGVTKWVQVAIIYSKVDIIKLRIWTVWWNQDVM